MILMSPEVENRTATASYYLFFVKGCLRRREFKRYLGSGGPRATVDCKYSNSKIIDFLILTIYKFTVLFHVHLIIIATNSPWHPVVSTSYTTSMTLRRRCMYFEMTYFFSKWEDARTLITGAKLFFHRNTKRMGKRWLVLFQPPPILRAY